MSDDQYIIVRGTTVSSNYDDVPPIWNVNCLDNPSADLREVVALRKDILRWMTEHGIESPDVSTPGLVRVVDEAEVWLVRYVDLGICDTCDDTYNLASRDGRCGDCGNCARHCSHHLRGD